MLIKLLYLLFSDCRLKLDCSNLALRAYIGFMCCWFIYSCCLAEAILYLWALNFSDQSYKIELTVVLEVVEFVLHAHVNFFASTPLVNSCSITLYSCNPTLASCSLIPFLILISCPPTLKFCYLILCFCSTTHHAQIWWHSQFKIFLQFFLPLLSFAFCCPQVQFTICLKLSPVIWSFHPFLLFLSRSSVCLLIWTSKKMINSFLFQQLSHPHMLFSTCQHMIFQGLYNLRQVSYFFSSGHSQSVRTFFTDPCIVS